MKNQLFVLLIISGFVLSSCSSNKKPDKSAAVIPATVANRLVSADNTVTEISETNYEEGEADYKSIPQALETISLSQQDLEQFLQKYNLASVWLGTIHAEEASASVFNGFYGTDRYRIEMYFGSVEKDTKQPNVYHVTGKSRFKQNVVPFKGKITIDSINYIQDTNLDQVTLYNSGFKEVFVAKGHFELKEDATYKGSGVFAGNVLIDLGIRNYDESFDENEYEENEIDTWTAFYKEVSDNSGVQLTGVSRGSGFLMDGSWTSYETSKSKPILVAKDIFMISNDILENFMIGERDVVINPKYRKLGWDGYWSNEEWWNEAKPIF